MKIISKSVSLFLLDSIASCELGIFRVTQKEKKCILFIYFISLYIIILYIIWILEMAIS